MAAKERRDVVLRADVRAGLPDEVRLRSRASISRCPAPQDIQAPEEQTVEGVDAGYFTSWVQQQVIERYGAPRAFAGGLKIKTTLDLGLQRAAEQSINDYLAYSGGSQRLARGDRKLDRRGARDGRRAQLRRKPLQPRDRGRAPARLLVQGVRPRRRAARRASRPTRSGPRRKRPSIVHGPHGDEKFVVHNDEGAYTGANTLTGAIAYSDNSIFAEVGLKVGTTHIADLAHRMGITTPISTNPAMTIGGLSIGVTPLDMAHAYETIAHGGQRVSGTLAEDDAPVGIQEVVSPSSPLPDGSHRDVNRVRTKPVLPAGVAATETEMLETVLQYGTAKAAALDEFAAGKTGTTSNYVDAWFVGWNHKYTVAVWVGYPEGAKPMTTDFDGGPVLGGTFPALIWHDFMISALGIEKERAEHTAASKRGAGADQLAANRARAPPKRLRRRARGRRRARPRRRRRRGAARRRRQVRHARWGRRRSRKRAAGAGGGEHEHAASPAPATPTPEAPSAPPPPPHPRRPHRRRLLALADGRGQRRGSRA